MSISDFIKKTDDEDVRRHPSRSGRGVDPTILLERSFLQWNIIDSIANAVVGWLIICTYLFWMDPDAHALSISGVCFILLGLVCFADIFGVLLYKTNYFIMVWQKRVHPPFPDIRHLKKLGWIANIFWFAVMFIASKYSFDLVYDIVRSFVRL